MANRLAGETSPYLLQHKDNPVDWYPWGEEAFARAKAEDKPVFLSVGYSSCHWCHVMEHESFESDEVAAVLNESFVSVKVDREERPDVDEAYMTAVQLSSGRGGWPMSVFLTPDKKPFFAGTYFPKEDRGQHPGFMTLCRQIAQIWKTKRAELEENASEFALGLTDAMGRKAPSTFAKFDEQFLANGVRALAADFDNVNGGFGAAPKFPPHTSIDFLLRYALRPTAPAELRELSIGMALATLEQMALGGIHDHVGGGFHRYSTDDHWLLPHFEKMLYDNALMLSNYSLAAATVHGVDPNLELLFAQAAHGVASWTIVEMMSPEGLFCSALDADTEGEEGKFYVWTVAEVREVLKERADAFIQAFGLEEQGNFEDEATGKRMGANIPYLKQPVAQEFDTDLELLREAREKRPRPMRDDKSLVSWNGLMIAALAQSGLIDHAETAAKQILEADKSFGELPHQITGGVPAGKGYLDDYAAFALALFQLARARSFMPPGEVASALLQAEAERLTGKMIKLFWDESEGGFFATSSGHEELFGKSKPAFDSPTPSANALALKCLIELGDDERARRLLSAFMGWMERAPQATEALYAAGLALVEASGAEVASAAEPRPEAPVVKEVVVRLDPKEIKADSSGVGRGEVVLSIPEGFHLNGNDPPARWLAPTALTFQPLAAKIDYPPAVDEAYEGEVRIPFALTLPAGSSGEEFEVKVSYQTCTDTECLAASETVLNGVLLR